MGALGQPPAIGRAPFQGSNVVSVDLPVLRLSEAVARERAALDAIDRTGAPAAACAAALTRWRDAIEDLLDARARTVEGIRAKAEATRAVLAATLRDGPGVALTDHARPSELLAWSLVHDILGVEADWS